MKITMKTLYATPERSVQIGETADLPAAEAKRLIDEGFAVRADDDPAEMTAEQRAKRSSSRSRSRKGKAGTDDSSLDSSGSEDDDTDGAGDADHAAFLAAQGAGDDKGKR